MRRRRGSPKRVKKDKNYLTGECSEEEDERRKKGGVLVFFKRFRFFGGGDFCGINLKFRFLGVKISRLEPKPVRKWKISEINQLP